MKKNQIVDAVHPRSGEWEKATVLGRPRGSKPRGAKGREIVVPLRFERDGYTVDQPVIFVSE